MGLDNYPNRYPCRTQQTAVYADRDGTEVIDCGETIEQGRCPWANANPPENGRVLGIFGAPCWYRGKWGNALVEQYGTYDESAGLSFYGSNTAGDYKTPDECRTLAEHIENVVTDTDTENGWRDVEDKDGLLYAAWWLRWVAENGDGAIAWY